jgi:hypothetical protein
VELESRVDRAYNVVAPVHDDAGNGSDALNAVEQLVLVREETAIDEIVSLDARQRERELGRAELVLTLRIWQQRARRALPDGPRSRGCEALRRVRRAQAPMERAEQIVALRGRNGLEEFLPLVRE